MPIIVPPPIDAAPIVPVRGDRLNFGLQAYNWQAWEKVSFPQLTALGANVYNNALESYNNANAANASAIAAANSAADAGLAAGITQWNAATNYATGARVWSPTNYQAYVRKTPGGVNATDPAADVARTYWEPVIVNGLYLTIVAGVNATAKAGQLMAITNVALTTITGPAAALAGDRWGVVVCNGLLTNVVDWNGLKHQGSAVTTTVLDDAYAWIEPNYISAGYGWSFKA
jgi:hypothetical protein